MRQMPGDAPALDRFGKVIRPYRLGAEEPREHSDCGDFPGDTTIGFLVTLEILHKRNYIRFRERFYARSLLLSEARKLLQIVAVSVNRIPAQLTLDTKMVSKRFYLRLHIREIWRPQMKRGKGELSLPTPDVLAF